MFIWARRAQLEAELKHVYVEKMEELVFARDLQVSLVARMSERLAGACSSLAACFSKSCTGESMQSVREWSGRSLCSEQCRICIVPLSKPL